MRLIDADAIPWTDLNDDLPTKIKVLITFADKVNRMPTIEERKTGKWIIQDNPGTGWYRVVCSECDENVTSNIPMIGFFPHCEPLWDYCPYCGADMRGEQE